MTNERRTHTSLNLPTALHRAIKAKLAGEGRDFTAWVIEKMEAEVARKEAPAGNRQPRSRPAKQ